MGGPKDQHPKVFHSIPSTNTSPPNDGIVCALKLKVKPDAVEVWNNASSPHSIQKLSASYRSITAHARFGLSGIDRPREGEEGCCDTLQWAMQTMAGDWI
ncbi:hypothetical protein OPV22_007624 [Ensete ventricosum]|uniref:Uncharacterized protein n=1 Tax=Ensete ventricosum TaxID=4639 RepID=A0AAV8RS23_ENSVE|nr:hypothetical protein OPV22_007624 [Ensete ventricosum]